MKNVRLLLATIFILSATIGNAQAKKYKIEGKKCTRVEIIDPGELYSTYVLQDEEIELLKIEKVKPFLLENIINNHTEETWPSALGDLTARVASPDKLKSYIAYKICKMENKYLLVLPARYNTEMGDGWAPAKDIFIVIGESGVKE